MPPSAAYRAATRHQELGPDFYDIVQPARFPDHILRYRNQRWAERVGLGSLTDEEWIDHFGRFTPLPENLEQPLALRYHGHQFRSYNPHLGDGRGFLFAQLHDAGGRQASRSRHQRQRANAMVTSCGWPPDPEGRRAGNPGDGDARSARRRDIEILQPDRDGRGTRPRRRTVAHPLIGPGAAQPFPYPHRNIPALSLPRRAAQHPQAARLFHPDLHAGDLARRRSGSCSGFSGGGLPAGCAHGRAMDGGRLRARRSQHRQHQHHGRKLRLRSLALSAVYDPAFTAAYFDETGLYAFGRQPDALLWNLYRLAECLLPLAPQASLEQALATFEPALHREFPAAITRRLGLQSKGFEQDGALAKAVWTFLHESKAPFEQIFFDWYGGASERAACEKSPSSAHL